MQQSPAQRASNARDADISAKAAEAPSWIKEQNMCPNLHLRSTGLRRSHFQPTRYLPASVCFYDAVLYAKRSRSGLILRFLLLVGAMAAGVGIGSKVLFALTQIPEFLKEPTLRNLGEIIWTSGFVFYGGLFGAILAVKLYAKVFRLNGQTFLDQIAPAFLLSISGEGSAAFCRLLLRKTCWLGHRHAADTGRAAHSDSVDRNGLSACYFHRTAPAAAPKVPCSCAPDLSHFLCSLPVCAGIFRGDELRGIWLGRSTSQWISLAIILYLR